MRCRSRCRVTPSVWVKICGLTTLEAVHAALAGGADALGFVFAPSKRQVTAAQAHALAREVAGRAARVAVMQHPTQALIDEVCEIFRPDILQTDASDLAALRVPAEIMLLPVVRDGQSIESVHATRVLYEGETSGAGSVADWSRAKSLAARTQLILAGGLNASNVAAAIAEVHPFGVDVSSGVESAPGVKDIGKIEAFISAARQAASALARNQ